MSTFQVHTEETAPAGSVDVLGKVRERYGFIPNLAGYLAESPTALGALLSLAGTFDKASLTPKEQQVVLLTVSSMNGCQYCKTAHVALGRKAELDDATLQAILNFETLPDAKENALRDFVRVVVEERGWASEEAVAAFLESGYTKGQVFEVVLGVALKTLTNYSNHIVGAVPNPEFVEMADGVLV